MRLDRIWIGNFKNLIDVQVDFDESNLTTVLIGQNTTGKSNLVEALVWIFRNLDLEEEPPFNYQIVYECRGRLVCIDADLKSSKRIKILVDGKSISYSSFRRHKYQYLPNNVFGYYSGTSKRLESYFGKHREKFYRMLLSGREAPLRRLFYARAIHSQYVLLSFFSFEDEDALRFLSEYLGIEEFVKATFVFKQPEWFRRKDKDDLFWGARGVVRRFLDDLSSVGLPPIRREERVAIGFGRAKSEERLHLQVPDLKTLRELASRYKDNVEFFKMLESTHLSDLIHELVIEVRKIGIDEPINFPELSEGEQQLLTVLGLLRFTNQEESLFLLDEPDTHLNPAWKLEYMDLLRNVVGENKTSHVLVVTHDPLLVGGLRKEQVQIFYAHGPEKRIVVSPPEEDPVGMGVAGLLTSELFGLRTTLDLETQRKLDRKKELAVKEKLRHEEKAELEALNEELASMGFLSAFRDPLYSRFLRALREYEEFEKPAITPEGRAEQAKLAREIIKKLKEEQT